MCYLGSKGAGARIFLDIAKYVKNANLENQYSFIFNGDLEFAERLKGLQSALLPGGSRILRPLIFMLRFPEIRRSVLRLLNQTSTSRIVFVMPSPADWFLNKILTKHGFEVIHTIHDAKRHPGELWPRKKSISWRIQCSKFTLCFTNFVAQECAKISSTADIRVINHPNFFPIENENPIMASLPKEFILFVGRNKSYKGLSRLLRCYLEIQPPIPLLVAGDSMTEASNLEEYGVFVINRWLTDAEHDFLIRRSSFVILPYTEASQSGILSAAMMFRKRVIVSRVGGLIEQVGNYELVSWVSPTDDGSLRVCLGEVGKENSSDLAESDLSLLAASTYEELLKRVQE